MLASSSHQLGIATCSACWATQSWALSMGSLGGYSHGPGSSSSFSLLKNSATCGSSMGGPPRSSSLGWDQSACFWSPGWRERVIYLYMGCDQSVVSGVASASEFRLDSSKVTHLLGCMGLAEGFPPLSSLPRLQTFHWGNLCS